MNVDLAGPRRGTEELDAAAAVDEVEEDELAHVAPRQHTPGEPARLRALDVVLEDVGLGADVGDLVPIGKALRRHGDLTIAQALGPFSGVWPSRTTAKPCDS